MRNFRLFVVLCCPILIFTALLSVSAGHEQSKWPKPDLKHESSSKRKFFSNLFSFHGPSALFTPTATISLTDDNSTSFAARPAAFGPLLPIHGLSGPIWIGSGFADDVLRRGGLGSTVEGELGCNDIPGWDGREFPLVERSISREFDDSDDHLLNDDEQLEVSASYGTDRALPGQAAEGRAGPANPTRLADAHFVQQSAEISGRIVLLSRGGCGFSDKVKWAQRRGATAVIVGDNIRGGALVRMYARGETSNITIPSVFTSHGTAHLLSTLMPPELDVNTPLSRSKKQPLPSSMAEIGGHIGESRAVRNVSNKKSSKYLQWLKAIFDYHSFFGRPTIVCALPSSPRARYRKNSDGTYKIGYSDDRQRLHSPKGSFDGDTSLGDGKILSDRYNISSSDRYDDDDDAAGSVTAEDVGGSWRGYIVPPEDMPSVDGSSRHSPPHSGNKGPELHDGLWVTLTPSSMSPSPFFNTLFMLVVSPLVTLGIVYTMLLLRTRIQRRRWRAPKSVVDRLPIRIYRTVAARLSPTSEQPLDQTPLLSNVDAPSHPADIPTMSRSRTNSASGSAPQYGTIEHASASPVAGTVHEKESALAEWRRKFGGTQVECVICLEEYVDGVSRVLQLPCGHDFHAECITPWLTTRRRTCPICKGDVVRSLQGGRHSRLSSSHPIRPEDEEEVQVQAAETENLDDDADLPVPMEPVDDYEPDVERAAVRSPGPYLFNSGLARSLQRRFAAWRQGSEEQPDRNR